MDYKERFKFEPCDFDAPNSGFSPIYSWIWNSPISEKLIVTQIDEMQEQGIRAFYIIPEPPEFRPGKMETTLSPEYLSDEFFALVRFAIDYAAEKGLVTWLYDEGGWPSGSACGRVVEKHPECRAKRLAVKHTTAEMINIDAEIIAVFDSGMRLLDKIPESGEISVYYIEEMPTATPYLLDKNAVDEFIALTYEGCKRHLGDSFASKTFAMFTDEAILYEPFYLRDISEFEQKYGYCFRELVPALFDDMTDARARQFKLDYIEYCSGKFAETYLDALHCFCRENNLLLTGHMDGDDRLSGWHRQVGNALVHLRHMDIPGVDVILRQIFPGGDNNFFPRLASSAAHQIGASRAVSESFAVYGEGLSYDEMRYVCGYQFVRGINIINLMSVTSGRENFLSAQCRPHFIPDLPEAMARRTFNDYLSRIMYITSVGEICAQAALYMPMRDVWAENSEAEREFYRLGKCLEEQQVYFDLIDDEYICNTGKMCYNTIFLPPTDYIKSETVAALERFITDGGRVYAYEGENIRGAKAWDGEACRIAVCDNRHIRAMKRCADGQSIYVFFNESTNTQTFCITVDDAHKNRYMLDAADGKIYAHSDRVMLCSGGEYILLCTDAEYTAEPHWAKREYLCDVELTGCRAVCEYKFEHGKWNKYSNDRELTTWADDFSGTAVYSGEFSAEAGNAVIIDLGDVGGSCRVSINGRYVGESIMQPYEIYVAAEDTRSHNTIEIEVSNTGANELCAADFSEYRASIVGTYHAQTLEFERRSQKSGLRSAVKIYRG